MISHLSRRTALQLLAGAAAHAATSIPSRGTAGTKSQRPSVTQLRDLLKLDRGINFGIDSLGNPLNGKTIYRTSTDHASELTFDVSNNQISASITPEGLIRRACICADIAPLPVASIKGGVYTTKHLLYGGPWALRVMPDLPTGADTFDIEIALLENVLPIVTRSNAALRVHSLIFAPADLQNSDRAPRAILEVLFIENRGSAPRLITLSAPGMEAAPDKTTESSTLGKSRFVPLDMDDPARTTDSPIRLRIETGEINTVAVAWVLGESSDELEETIRRLRSRTVLDWVEGTLDARRIAYGKLSIAGDTFSSEMAVRFSELSRQSVLRTKDGRFSGGFLGSDVDTNQVNWPRDSYYSMLAMSMFDPRLCANAIPYHLLWNRPTETTEPGRSRFRDAGTVTQSLSNSVSGLSLAGAYYRSTGDRAFFRSRPEILENARTILGDVLQSRRGEPMLFPSMYFSDGEARGDYHTGSNVAAWFAFKSMSRIAAEVYLNDQLAQDWSNIAENIRREIDSRCVGDGITGKRFFEGSNTDGSFISGHDGEESETTLMPFYGFCQADDPRLLRHAELAMTTENPLYSPEIDGIWWFNSDWRSATFPGWTTALAGARDEVQLRARLNRIRSLTDLDGSIWWWPYPYGSKDQSLPVRADTARKCGWGAAVYLCRFVHDILGVAVDVPAASIRFAPFTPWDSFAWKNARIGASRFDLSFERSPNEVSATLTNNNLTSYSATVVLTGEKGSVLKDPRVSGAIMQRLTRPTIRESAAIQLELRLISGQAVRISAKAS